MWYLEEFILVNYFVCDFFPTKSKSFFLKNVIVKLKVHENKVKVVRYGIKFSNGHGYICGLKKNFYFYQINFFNEYIIYGSAEN